MVTAIARACVITMLRILQVITDPGIPLDGNKGATRHVLGVRNALRSLGHDVCLLAASPGALEDGKTVFRIPVGAAEGTERIKAAEAWLADPSGELGRRFGQVDVVLERLGLYSSAAHTLAGRLSAHHVLEVNAPLAEEATRHRGLADDGEAARLEERAIANADGVVTVSRELARRATRIRGHAASVLHLPNGVDVAPFVATAGHRETLREALGVERNTCVVVFVSTLKPWHGADRLLNAFECAIASGADLRLVFVGDGPERKRLVSRAGEMSCGKRVTFVGSVVPEEVPRWLAAADVGAAFYPPGDDFYFSPLKVAEYAAAGLPIARSRHADMDDLVPEGEGSLAVESEDIEGFAELLARLARDRNLREDLGLAARDRAIQTLDWTAKMRTLVAWIESNRQCASVRSASHGAAAM